MPSYLKFLKEILNKKHKLVENSMAPISEVFNAIIQNKSLSKVKDMGSFSIPCLVCEVNIKKAL